MTRTYPLSCKRPRLWSLSLAILQVAVRDGPAKGLSRKSLGYAPLNFTYLDVIFWHGVAHATINKWKACLFVLFFVRDIWPIQWFEKIQTRPWLACKKKKKGRQAGFPFVSKRFKHEVNFSDRNSQNCTGHRSSATCSHHNLFHVRVLESFFGRVLMGDELGSNRYRSSPWGP